MGKFTAAQLNVLLGFLAAISLFIFSTSNVYAMNETAINEQFDKSHYFEFSNVVSDYKHRTSDDLLSIFGAVKNNSTLDFENVLLGLAMYDKQDVLVNFASNVIFSDLDHPGGTSTFTFNIEMDPSLMYDHYRLLVAAKSQVGIVLAQEKIDPFAVVNGYCKMLDATKRVDIKVYERIAKKHHPEGEPHEVDPVEATYALGVLNLTDYLAFKNQNMTTCSDVQLIDNFRHINENYSPDDPNNPDNIVIQYCVQHADRVVRGENVIQDLVTAGLVPDTYSLKTCREVQEKHQWDKVVQDYNENKDALK